MAVRLALTPGDPRGIGPEVGLRGLDRIRNAFPDLDVVVFGPDGLASDAFLQHVQEQGLSRPDDGAWAGEIAGASIERAVEAALRGDVHGIVTAPLHKPSLHASGRIVPGQTEMLAQLAGVRRVGMLMAAERTRLDAPLRVLLGTTHLPLREVPAALTTEVLVDQTMLLRDALMSDWGFPAPRIGICALNPHASDGGLFGDEEERIFHPALEALHTAGVDATGPLPADTVFSRALAGEFDAIVAPYHDVGMAAFKTVSFGTGVNVTLGLPFVRTSPDHGTAFDIAGTGVADDTSMIEALSLAHRLANTRFDTPSADV